MLKNGLPLFGGSTEHCPFVKDFAKVGTTERAKRLYILRASRFAQTGEVDIQEGLIAQGVKVFNTSL